MLTSDCRTPQRASMAASRAPGVTASSPSPIAVATRTSLLYCASNASIDGVRASKTWLLSGRIQGSPRRQTSCGYAISNKLHPDPSLPATAPDAPSPSSLSTARKMLEVTLAPPIAAATEKLGFVGGASVTSSIFLAVESEDGDGAS
ncbi:uncharacterized protein LOC125527035, partial [Triticum urartu]|uniref:uncharacterized protein LOC125527035 n=1 Tax=Triticum urartu TaxID=4572 RepID=UPI002043ADEC